MAIEWLSDPEIWVSLVTLTALEIVLGIDNLVFIATLAGRLPADRQNRARQTGLALALITRLALLASIAWIIGLTRPVFDLFGHPVSWRDIVLVGGGFFLLYKGTREIHHRLEGDGPGEAKPREKISFSGVKAARRVCRAIPDGEDAGAQLSAVDRHDADRGWRWLPRPEGIYLCRDRFLGRGRSVEPARRAPAPLAPRRVILKRCWRRPQQPAWSWASST